MMSSLSDWFLDSPHIIYGANTVSALVTVITILKATEFGQDLDCQSGRSNIIVSLGKCYAVH